MNGTEKQNETSVEMPEEDSRVTMGNQTEKKHRFHLKMPQKGRKHSVKKRIAYTFIATMAATLLIIGLINYFFLGSFYIRDKEHILAESFQKLNVTGGDSDDIPDTFEQFCATNNLKVIITGPELSSFVYSNATDRQSLQPLIFGLISGNEQANTKSLTAKTTIRSRNSTTATPMPSICRSSAGLTMETATLQDARWRASRMRSAFPTSFTSLSAFRSSSSVPL